MGKKSFFLGILFLIVIFHALNNFVWLKLDARLPIEEAMFHFKRLEVYDILRQSYPIGDTIRSIFSLNDYYPPLFFVSAAVVNLFFGISSDTSIMINILYLALLLFSLYQIGKKNDSASTGLLAAMIVSLYPAVFGLSRVFQIQLALCSMVCFSIYCLVYSENFKNRKYSLLFGASVGLGMLTKWTFAFFLVGPLCCVFIESVGIFIRQNIKSRAVGMIGRLRMCYLDSVSQLVNILWSSLIMFSIAGVYYIRFLNIESLFKYAGTESTSLHRFEIKNIFFYFFELINDQISFFFFCVFALALLMLKISKAKLKNIKILASWILIPYIIFTFIFARKSSVYVFSFVPAIALITASGLMKIRTRLVKTIVISVALFLGLIQYFNLSFGSTLTREDLSLNTRIGSIDLIYKPHFFHDQRYFSSRIFCCPPVIDDDMSSAMNEAISCIDESRDKSLDRAVVTLDPYGIMLFNPQIWNYFSEENKIPIEVTYLSTHIKDVVRVYIDNLKNSHFWVTDIYVKKNDYIDYFKRALQIEADTMNFHGRDMKEEDFNMLRMVISEFRLIKQVPFEEDKRIYIYSR